MIFYSVMARILFWFNYCLRPCNKEMLKKDLNQGYYRDFENSLRGFWMFTGGLYLNNKELLKEDIYLSQTYLIFESLIRAERVYDLILKIYILNEISYNLTLVFLCISVIKLCIKNLIYSFVLNKVTIDKSWIFGLNVYLINFMIQASFVLFDWLSSLRWYYWCYW